MVAVVVAARGQHRGIQRPRQRRLHPRILRRQLNRPLKRRHALLKLADLYSGPCDPGVCLHGLPDDLRDDHTRAHHWRDCGTRSLFRTHRFRRLVGHGNLFPDRAYGLVLGRSGRSGDAAKALAAAADDAAKATAQANLDAVSADAGLIFQWGALDFAGGTVVHINAGIAGLVGALIIGKRTGYGKELMAPHSLTMTMIGAALLWVGWFGFNAGSNLEANGITALAFVNTMVATAAASLSWLFVEWIAKGKPSLLGLVSGAVAGLVAITPASGYAGPMGSVVLGLVAGGVCFFFCSTVKNAFGYDDSLDVFGVHCVGGIIGAIGTGIAQKRHGGTGITIVTGGDAGAAHLDGTGVGAGRPGLGLDLVGDAELLSRPDEPLVHLGVDVGPAADDRTAAELGLLGELLELLEQLLLLFPQADRCMVILIDKGVASLRLVKTRRPSEQGTTFSRSIVREVARTGTVHAVQERGHVEEPRPVLHEVHIHHLRAGEWAAGRGGGGIAGRV